MDRDKIIECFRLGITDHKDLGIIDGFYCELIKIGPIEKIFKVERGIIDLHEEPARSKKRLECLEREVVELHKQIREVMGIDER